MQDIGHIYSFFTLFVNFALLFNGGRRESWLRAMVSLFRWHISRSMVSGRVSRQEHGIEKVHPMGKLMEPSEPGFQFGPMEREGDTRLKRGV